MTLQKEQYLAGSQPLLKLQLLRSSEQELKQLVEDCQNKPLAVYPRGIATFNHTGKWLPCNTYENREQLSTGTPVHDTLLHCLFFFGLLFSVFGAYFLSLLENQAICK